MQYNPINIVTGILVLFVISYVLISIFSFIYLGLTNGQNVKGSKLLLSLVVVTLAWIISTFIGLMVTVSAGLLFFAVFSLLLIFGFSFLLSEKLLGVSGKSRIIYCLLLAILFNPAWLSFIKVL
jgi:hypothetical protein